jgi:hypothetical protein
VPVTLNRQQVYFWYFEDLQPEGTLNFRDINRFREGEAVITMEPTPPQLRGLPEDVAD